MLSSRASLQARPVRCRLVGSPLAPKPLGVHSDGRPPAVPAVISAPDAGPSTFDEYASEKSFATGYDTVLRPGAITASYLANRPSRAFFIGPSARSASR